MTIERLSGITCPADRRGLVASLVAAFGGMAAMRQIPFQIANVTSAFLWAGGVIAPSFLGVAWLAGH